MSAHPWRRDSGPFPTPSPSNDWLGAMWAGPDRFDFAALADLVRLTTAHRVTGPMPAPDRSLRCRKVGAHVVCYVPAWGPGPYYPREVRP